MKIIYPLELKEKDLPLIVLLDDRRGWLGFLIKRHTSGVYGHIAEMVYPGYFASQDFVGYREVDVEKYLKPHITLKFWRIKDITDKEKQLWREVVEADLNAPWVRRRYDILGFIGALLHIRWLQNPHIEYCGEKVADRFRSVFNLIVPKQSTPSELNKFMEEHKRFECIGYWLQ